MQERTVILYTCSKRFAMTGWRLGAAVGPSSVIDVINKFNTNAESCTPHFIQRGMVAAIEGEILGPADILNTLRERRDACINGLNAIDGIDVATPNSTFYVFPNVNRIMERKGLRDVNALMEGALKRSNVSFCTRKHFGRLVEGESNHYIRFAYSGIDVPDINAGLKRLKTYFDSVD
jgi:aspartate/methionine/tyrosine aminotransferase